MTSEHDLNINKETSTNGEEKTTIEENKKEVSLIIDIKNEEEQMNIDKPESDDDNEKEKHDISYKSETEITDDDLDTQPLFGQPIIIEGKRSRKPTLRLEISELVPVKKELLIPQGHGKPLGEIEYINYQISHASTDTLSRMRTICFGRRGNKVNIRKHLREFNGFEFERKSDEYKKHLNNLIKLKKDQLRSISLILGLPSTGRNTDHAERILNFLIQPIDEGKRIPGKKSVINNSKKRSTNSKESINTNKKIENGKDEHELDYVYKPGKKSSNKHSSNHENSNDNKRKKITSTKSKSKENEEIIASIDEHKQTVKEIESDIIDSKPDQNEAIMNDTVQNII